MNIKYQDVADAIARDDSTGFCLECGAEADGVEPDAEFYTCEVCGVMAVARAEQILLLDLVE